MHKTPPVLVIKMYKDLRDFEIQKNHEILSRRPDLELLKKKLVT